MTVHASKGLEAPIVFLVDPGSAAAIPQHQPRLVRFPSARGNWQGDGWLWNPGGGTANAFMSGLGQAIAQRAEEEYRRLLYVGMTRAEDRLIVCGYHGIRGQNAGTWHTLVAAAFAGSDHVA